MMLQFNSSVVLYCALLQTSQPASGSDDTYLFDGDALCDEFDFLNNLTDSDDQLSPEGTRFVYYGHTIIMISYHYNLCGY